MPRPKQLIGLFGTHTEVGKTWVATQLLARLRHRGHSVAARKPAQSFEPDSADTDAALLAKATGEDERAVCPEHRCYPLAMAPPMAADILRRPRIELKTLVAEIEWPANLDIGIVETVGGPRSPIAHDGDSLDLLHRIQPDGILLISDAGLGTLNAVRLCLSSIGRDALVFLNRYDATNELHRLNYRWLRDQYAIDVALELDELATAVTDRSVLTD